MSHLPIQRQVALHRIARVWKQGVSSSTTGDTWRLACVSVIHIDLELHYCLSRRPGVFGQLATSRLLTDSFCSMRKRQSYVRAPAASLSSLLCCQHTSAAGFSSRAHGHAKCRVSFQSSSLTTPLNEIPVDNQRLNPVQSMRQRHSGQPHKPGNLSLIYPAF